MKKEEDELNPEEIVADIQKACAKLGWCIALIDSSAVSGLIIGTDEYVDSVVSLCDEDYEIWAHPNEEQNQLH